VRLEQQIRHDRRLHFARRKICEARLWMLADIGVGPAVETALLHAGQIVRGQAIAEAVALLHRGVKVAGLRLEREAVGLRMPDAYVV
jgi:hypothetical protein